MSTEIVTVIVSAQVPHESRVISRQPQFTMQQLPAASATLSLADREITRLRDAVRQELRELDSGAVLCTDGKLRVRRM